MLVLRRAAQGAPRHGSRLQTRNASTTTRKIPLIIQGKDVETELEYAVVSPRTNKKIWTCSAVSPEHVNKAVESAENAFPAWAATKPSYRRDLFLRTADIMEKRMEELREYMYLEMGGPKNAQDFVIGLAIEGLRDTAGRIAGAVTGSVPESFYPGMKAMVVKRPYGVNLGIAPWNAPYHLGLRSISFALAAGNTAILKGSEFSPSCYWAIADSFRQAGLPDGCLNLVFHRPGDASTVIDSLIAHPAVKKINFTGSSKVGRIISSTAGKHLKPVLMELGGKASAVVLKDANLEMAALHCARGALFNAGQVCMATERILVHSSVADEFQALLNKAVNDVSGNPEDTPVLVSVAAADRNRALVQDALSKGAKCITPLSDLSNPHREVDAMMRPVILSGVNESMDIYQKESFGPSVSFFTFDTEEEAIRLANNTEYGLSAAVFSENLGAAFRLAESIDSGAIHINSMTVHDEFALPHGGVKASGFGRFNGYQGLDEFLYYKTITWME